MPILEESIRIMRDIFVMETFTFSYISAIVPDYVFDISLNY